MPDSVKTPIYNAIDWRGTDDPNSIGYNDIHGITPPAEGFWGTAKQDLIRNFHGFTHAARTLGPAGMLDQNARDVAWDQGANGHDKTLANQYNEYQRVQALRNNAYYTRDAEVKDVKEEYKSSQDKILDRLEKASQDAKTPPQPETQKSDNQEPSFVNPFINPITPSQI